MKYTERDIEQATRLKSEGFNWIATNKNGRPFAYGRMPYRCADDDSNEYNIWDNQPGTPWRMLSKEYFKSITWENEPVYVDEIITEGEAQVNEDIEIARLTAENTELCERLNRAGELPCKVGDTLYEPFIDRIREWIVDSIYVFSLGINVNCERKDDCRWHDHFAIREKYTDYNDFESRVYLTREAAEAKLAELKGGRV